MTVNNAASAEVRQHHMANINAMFNSTGQGENLWDSLTDREREMFCKQGGFQRSTADIPLSKMRPDIRRKLLQTIKDIARASSLFNNLSLCDFGTL
jgi:predicted ATP-binding protein involved in virulence